MAFITFSDKDLLRGKLITPSWYRCSVEEAGAEQPTVTDKGPSTNYPISITVIKNADTGDETFTGVPVDFNFNSKAIGLAVGFIAACMKVLPEEVKSGVRYRLDDCKGKVLDIFIKNKEYQGRMLNNVDHTYRPAKDE